MGRLALTTGGARQKTQTERDALRQSLALVTAELNSERNKSCATAAFAERFGV